MDTLKKKIIKLYDSGLSLSDVAKIVGYKSPNSVKNILMKENICRRGKAGYKKPFNESFFHDIDSEEKAYFLGFMMADGNVYIRQKSKPCIRMELSRKDKYILERFEELLGLEDKVKDTRKNCCILRFHSKIMFDDLARHGIIPNKTGKEKISNIDKKLIRHFIRGFFDGDGWVTNTTSHGKNKGSRKCIGFVKSKGILKEIQTILHHELDTKMNKITDRKGCSMILYSSKKDVRNIIDYMYDNSTIYLKRKYNSCYSRIEYVNIERVINK